MSTVEPKQPDRSLPELIGVLSSDITLLVRKEFELAREEIRTEASRAGKAGAALGAAAVVGLLAAIALVLAAGWGLATVMPAGLAFLIVALVLGGVGAVLGLRGKKQLQTVNPMPEQTIETLREDKKWLSEQKS
jgi:hypothetical protein